jgi:hypothetical protein
VTLEISQTYKSQSVSMGIEGTCVPNASETAPAIAVLSSSHVTERLIDVKMLAFACKSIYDSIKWRRQDVLEISMIDS